MTELVYLKNDEAVCSSLQVAEKFGKRHDRVLRAIDNLLETLPKNGEVSKMFILSKRKAADGQFHRMYFMNRDVSVPISGTLRLYNPWSESHPIFKISGEGVCKITVNGKEVSANVGQNLLINTNLMQTYREDGALNNTAITGDYENLYLQEGLNEISVSSGFAAEVIPKWGVRL